MSQSWKKTLSETLKTVSFYSKRIEPINWIESVQLPMPLRNPLRWRRPLLSKLTMILYILFFKQKLCVRITLLFLITGLDYIKIYIIIYIIIIIRNIISQFRYYSNNTYHFFGIWEEKLLSLGLKAK